MLLEDVITFNLPHIFSYFGYDEFSANAFKVTKDAELDLDNDIRTNFAEKIEKGLKTEEKESQRVSFLIKIWIRPYWKCLSGN